MFGSLLRGAWKGTKAIAAGNTQAKLGIQSPHLPAAVVRIGRFLYTTSMIWYGAAWYTGYANARTSPGSGPSLVLPGTPKIGSVDRPPPAAKWITNGASGSGPSNVGGSQSGITKGTPSGKAGGFLPKGASYKPGRKDQGRDGQTNPGGPIIAPGAGYVLKVLSNANGFGPNYPIVKFSSGPYKGRIMYIGHTHTALRSGQSFTPGTVLSYTGRSPVGNASVPGWFEIGFADTGSPGPNGQPVPF